MSLSYKTSLLACQRMVDSKHFSRSTVTREIRQRKVVAKAKGVPKLLLVQRQRKMREIAQKSFNFF